MSLNPLSTLFDASDRLLVIAPHPDDEALGAGGLIWQARQQNVPVRVAFMTSGDGNRVGTIQRAKQPLPRPRHYAAYATLREAEALEAMNALGVPPSDALFLRLPDQGLRRLLQAKYQNQPYRSPFTRRVESPEGLAYTGQAVLARLQELVSEFRPTVALLPLLEDTHADHRAAGLLAYRAIKSSDINISAYSYPIHYRFFPKPRGINPRLPLLIPRHHPRKDWLEPTLSPAAVSAKSQAVEAYRSQLRVPLLGRLMRSLVRGNELLLPLP